MSELGLVVPPATHAGGRCALCLDAFRMGDTYTTIWRKDRPRASSRPSFAGFALLLHPGCRAELAEGDLGRLFAALERGLALPLAVLFGRRPSGAG